MLKLRIQLQERDAKNAATIAEMTQKATDLRNQCEFQEAASVLGRIPPELATSDSDYLLSECQKLSFNRQTALKALQNAMKTQSYAQGMSEADTYAKQLLSRGLRDPKFNQQYQACFHFFKVNKKAEESTEHTRRVRARIEIPAAIIVTLSLWIAAGFWLRSSKRANSIPAEKAKAEADRMGTEKQKRVEW
jgi:hypothetical protein